MIDRIEVHKGEERGTPKVILTGALSEILAFTQGHTTTAPNGDNGRVLVVAGARSRRCLHLDYAALILRRQKNNRFLRASSASVVRHCSLIDFRMTCPSVSSFDIRTKCISEIGNRN